MTDSNPYRAIHAATSADLKASANASLVRAAEALCNALRFEVHVIHDTDSCVMKISKAIEVAKLAADLEAQLRAVQPQKQQCCGAGYIGATCPDFPILTRGPTAEETAAYLNELSALGQELQPEQYIALAVSERCGVPITQNEYTEPATTALTERPSGTASNGNSNPGGGDPSPGVRVPVDPFAGLGVVLKS